MEFERRDQNLNAFSARERRDTACMTSQSLWTREMSVPLWAPSDYNRSDFRVRRADILYNLYLENMTDFIASMYSQSSSARAI